MFLKDRFARVRKEKGMSLEMVAQGLSALGYDVSRQAVFHWESGINTPKFEAVLFIAKLFKIKATYFFDPEVR